MASCSSFIVAPVTSFRPDPRKDSLGPGSEDGVTSVLAVVDLL
jgi:hypothetical protein